MDQILKDNGKPVDRAVDAVGYQAVSNTGDKEEPNVSDTVHTPCILTILSGGANKPHSCCPTNFPTIHDYS